MCHFLVSLARLACILAIGLGGYLLVLHATVVQGFGQDQSGFRGVALNRRIFHSKPEWPAMGAYRSGMRPEPRSLLSPMTSA